jgi:putative transposase
MSRKGMPADNAPIEYFHSSLKCEIFRLNIEQNYSTTTVINIVMNYIKKYNNHRIQRKLGYLSPIAYQEQMVSSPVFCLLILGVSAKCRSL